MNNTQTSSPQQPDKSDIQGLILRGYTHPCSVHMLFKFNDTKGVAGFFSALMPYLRSAENWGTIKPDMMLNIGLTWGGIQLLRPSFQQFPPEFIQGPEGQSDLRDFGASDPSNWWNGQFKTSDIHCVVHAYAMTSASQTAIVKIVEDAAKSSSTVQELFPLNSVSGRLEQFELPNDQIHFGYRDSIDEPALDLGPVTDVPLEQEYLANFLIGYEVNGTTIAGPTGTSDEALFANNGCYNAFRILYQNVPAFENFLDANASKMQAHIPTPPAGAPADYYKEMLAAKMNGRWRNGSPLVLSPQMYADDTATTEDFSYTGDTQGLSCPFSSHTRVSNPRDQPLSGANVISGVPRIIRRGAPYGAPYNKETDKGSEERGLIGLFLCGTLKYQFQTLYRWINENNFSGPKVFPYPHVMQDALIASRMGPDGKKNKDTSFTIPFADGKCVIADLPEFVVTRGTAYFLLPSISTLKAIAAGK